MQCKLKRELRLVFFFFLDWSLEMLLMGELPLIACLVGIGNNGWFEESGSFGYIPTAGVKIFNLKSLKLRYIARSMKALE